MTISFWDKKKDYQRNKKGTITVTICKITRTFAKAIPENILGNKQQGHGGPDKHGICQFGKHDMFTRLNLIEVDTSCTLVNNLCTQMSQLKHKHPICI